MSFVDAWASGVTARVFASRLEARHALGRYGAARWRSQVVILEAWPPRPAWEGTVADDIATDDGLERHFRAMPFALLERTVPGLRVALVEAAKFGDEVEAHARRRLQIAERVLEEKQGRLW